MELREGTLLTLAQAVADGASVDWEHAESSAEGPDERHIVQKLRVLASVVDVARAEAPTWGPLQIRGDVGGGTFGTVYRAWDTRLEREVALKLLNGEQAGHDLSSTVVKEARLLAQIRHPNVVTVHGADVFEGRVGIWMEFVTGRTLKEIIEEQGPFGAHEAALIGRDLCRALAAVHKLGFLHGDIKAQNVMREAGGRIVLMDFGAGHAATAAASAPLQGSPVYLAPEVLAGDAPSVSSDLYALGVLLYHLVSGEFPVTGQSLAELRDNHARGRRTLLRDVRPDVPSAFVRVVDHAIAADPAERPQSAGTIDALLEGTLASRDDQRSAQGGLDRWTSAQPLHREQITVGTEPSRAVTAKAAAARPKPLRRIAGGTTAALLVLSAMLLFQQRSREPAVAEIPRPPVSLLVADFDNRTGDAVFDGALEHAIAIGLEGASFVSVFPRSDALRSASTIAPGARLGVDSARLVAQREGVTGVVSGLISAASTGYVLSVHILDAVPGVPIASARHLVAAKDEVLPAIAAIARELRQGLGDHALKSGAAFSAETFTTASLDAAREYSLGQDLLTGGTEEQAIERFTLAVRHDPQFGRAYAGWGVAADRLGRTAEARALFDKALSLRDRMTRRERLRTEGLYMMQIIRDHRRGVEIYRTLATEFPADGTALNNLAVGEFMLLDFKAALETGRRAVLLRPTAQYHQNLALYALYAGDMRTATEHAQKALALNPKSALSHLPLAIRATLDGNLDEAQRLYARMAGSGARGVALSVIGVADLESFRGNSQIAGQHALEALSSETIRSNVRVSAALHLLLAEGALLAGDAREALTRARRALRLDATPTTLFRSAEILALAGAHGEAAKQPDALSASQESASAWYRRILAARLAGTKGDTTALAALEQAFETERPMWTARNAAGMMRLARGDARAAVDHFEWCLQHYAEATAAYLDDVPTVRYVAQVRYWRARALDEAGDKPAAAAAYDVFLRSRNPDDPLARDARTRVERARPQ